MFKYFDKRRRPRPGFSLLAILTNSLSIPVLKSIIISENTKREVFAILKIYGKFRFKLCHCFWHFNSSDNFVPVFLFCLLVLFYIQGYNGSKNTRKNRLQFKHITIKETRRTAAVVPSFLFVT